MTSQPIAFRMPGAEAPGMPLPESTTIFSGRLILQSPRMRAVYSGRMSSAAIVPGCAASE